MSTEEFRSTVLEMIRRRHPDPAAWMKGKKLYARVNCQGPTRAVRYDEGAIGQGQIRAVAGRQVST